LAPDPSYNRLHERGPTVKKILILLLVVGVIALIARQVMSQTDH
jgi:hypothetical protein